MPRPRNAIPTKHLNVVLPVPLLDELNSRLYSNLEGRVPHGAYAAFLGTLLREEFTGQALDLSPYLGSAPGAFVIKGAPETLAALTAYFHSKEGTSV